MLQAIRNDYVTCHVLFELGPDEPQEKQEAPEIHRIAIAGILRHTRPGDPDPVAACLNRIGGVFRRDTNAILFAGRGL